MAKVTLTVEGSTIGKASIVTEYDQENSDRFVAFMMAEYGTDEDGNPRDLEGVVGAMWAAITAGVHANIERHEREAAAQAARDAVVPMEAIDRV